MVYHSNTSLGPNGITTVLYATTSPLRTHIVLNTGNKQCTCTSTSSDAVRSVICDIGFATFKNALKPCTHAHMCCYVVIPTAHLTTMVYSTLVFATLVPGFMEMGQYPPLKG